MSERAPLIPVSNMTGNDLRAAVERTKSFLPTLSRVAGALSAGKFPTNQQAIALAQAALKSELLQPSNAASLLDRGGRIGERLSDEGEQLIADVREAIESVIQISMEKNDDDLLQNFFYEASKADIDGDIDLKSHVDTDAAPSKGEVEADAKKLRQAVQKLGRTLLTSADFRDLISQAIIIGRDLFADAAESAAQAAISVAQQAKSASDSARPTETERKRGIELPNAKQARQLGRRAQTDVKAASRDVRSAVEDASTKVQNWIDEKTPDDISDAISDRVRQYIDTIQRSPEYNEATQTLIDLLNKYAESASEIVSNSSITVDGDVDPDDHAREAAGHLRTLIERIAGGKNLDDLFGKLKKVMEDVRNDGQLKSLWNEIGEYVKRLLLDPGYAMSPKSSRRFDQLYKKSQDVAKSNATYKGDFDAVTKEVESYLEAVKNDTAFARLGVAMDRLTSDLDNFQQVGFNVLRSEGQGLAQDFYQVLLPRALRMIREIPFPRIEFRSQDWDFAIENVMLESASFIPDLTRLLNHNDLTLEQGYAAFAANFDTSASLTVRGLRLQASNISYYVAKKTGMFHYEDSGLLDIRVGFGSDDGLHFKVKLEKADDRDRELFFKVVTVEVELENFNVYVRESQHGFLTWLFQNPIRSNIERQLREALEEQIKTQLRSLDLSCYGLRERATAANQAAATPMDYLRAMLSSSASSPAGAMDITRKGIIKKGRHGEWVLAIGVTEQLLPGKATPMSSSGDLEAGLAQARGVVQQAQAATNEIRQAGRKAQTEAQRSNRREARKNGWKSDAFNV